MKWVWILMVLASFGVLVEPSALAQGLQEVVVAPSPIKSQIFNEGSSLGTGVVEKEYEPPVKSKPTKRLASQKRRARALATLKKKAEAERSIASYPDDRKFSNDVIARVREKDAADREASLCLVRAGIERGEFGPEAKARLKQSK